MRDPRPRHVLVIDGAEEVSALMREVLEEEGYRVSLTTQAPRDPSGITPDGFGLVDLDPGLEVQDPEGWRQTIAPEDEARDLPLVICTGNRRILHDLAGDLADRTIDVVPKPVDIEKLLQVVDERCDPSLAALVAGRDP